MRRFDSWAVQDGYNRGHDGSAAALAIWRAVGPAVVTACSQFAISSCARPLPSVGTKRRSARHSRELIPCWRTRRSTGPPGRPRPRPRGLDDRRAHHRDAQQVGLELHQWVVGAGTAVHAQLAHWGRPQPRRRGSWPAAGRRFGNAFEARARNAPVVVPRVRAGDGAACVGLPVQGAQAGEGGHHHHAARIGQRFGPATRPRRCWRWRAGRRAATAPPHRPQRRCLPWRIQAGSWPGPRWW